MLKMVVMKIYGTIFAQDRPLVDSDGETIPDEFELNNIYIVIGIFPNG